MGRAPGQVAAIYTTAERKLVVLTYPAMVEEQILNPGAPCRQGTSYDMKYKEKRRMLDVFSHELWSMLRT